MRKVVFPILLLACLVGTKIDCFAQAQQPSPSPEASSQGRVVGVVTAIDNATRQLTIKTDTGESIKIVTNDKSAVLRLPPGETSAQNAAKITLGDIALGDRLFARGTTAPDGMSIEARQVVVTGGTVSMAAPPRQPEEFRQRALVGRITTLDSGKKEIILQSRSREGAGPIVVVVSDSTRFFRYAPDSLNIKDASRSSFAGLRIGDQLRALGERSADGARFSAAEVIAGSMIRTGGQVVAVNPAKNELTIKNGQGQNVTVSVGQRSSLRRVTPEMAASLAANRPQRQEGNTSASGAPSARQAGPPQNSQERRPRPQREGAPPQNGEERRPRPGRGIQDMLETLPAITIADLKKGDTVFVSGSEGADPSRVTAIMLLTGEPAFINGFLQNGPNRGPQSPGLPGDVIGGGVGPAERPISP